MTNIKMTAVDSIHVSSVGSEILHAGTEFDVPAHVADDLEKRGLAEKAKEAPTHQTKMEAAPENKSVTSKSAKAK